MSTETQARGWVSDLSPNGYLTLSLTPTLALTLPPRSRSLTLPRSLGLSFLLFGRGMKGPERGHVRDTTALPWERTVAIFAVMTTQRNQPVACCLSHKLHLCVRPSQLGTQGGFHLSALLCETTPPTIRRPSTPTTITIGGTLHVSALLCATIEAIDAIDAIHSAPNQTFRRRATPSTSRQSICGIGIGCLFG